MLSAIAAWFASEGAALVLGALAKLVLDGFNSYQGNKAMRELGRITAERDQETATRQATQRQLEASINAPQTVDDAISRLEDGSA
jgi:hypothetical protein